MQGHQRGGGRHGDGRPAARNQWHRPQGRADPSRRADHDPGLPRHGHAAHKRRTAQERHHLAGHRLGHLGLAAPVPFRDTPPEVPRRHEGLERRGSHLANMGLCHCLPVLDSAHHECAGGLGQHPLLRAPRGDRRLRPGDAPGGPQLRGGPQSASPVGLAAAALEPVSRYARSDRGLQPRLLRSGGRGDARLRRIPVEHVGTPPHELPAGRQCQDALRRSVQPAFPGQSLRAHGRSGAAGRRQPGDSPAHRAGQAAVAVPGAQPRAGREPGRLPSNARSIQARHVKRRDLLELRLGRRTRLRPGRRYRHTQCGLRPRSARQLHVGRFRGHLRGRSGRPRGTLPGGPGRSMVGSRDGQRRHHHQGRRRQRGEPARSGLVGLGAARAGGTPPPVDHRVHTTGRIGTAAHRLPAGRRQRAGRELPGLRGLPARPHACQRRPRRLPDRRRGQLGLGQPQQPGPHRHAMGPVRPGRPLRRHPRDDAHAPWRQVLRVGHRVRLRHPSGQHRLEGGRPGAQHPVRREPVLQARPGADPGGLGGTGRRHGRRRRDRRGAGADVAVPLRRGRHGQLGPVVRPRDRGWRLDGDPAR